ncbi:MAG: hypothetical protein JST84_15480 [Acidobacteria bacterium]|nr:hypothetical protein [Acidobacteriota bacterium]
MEREQELRKLINVLHRMTRTAARVQWMGAGENEARFAVSQYNKILARLSELDPNVKGVFDSLPEDATLTVVAMAARQVVSYYEDEVKTEHRGKDWGPQIFGAGMGKGCGPVDFNLEDIGNWIRDRLSEVQRHESERRAEGKHSG